MRTRSKIILTILSSFIYCSAIAQIEVDKPISGSDIIGDRATEIKMEQERLDRIDGVVDGVISLKSDLQSQEATAIYIELGDQILERIINSGQASKNKLRQLTR